MPYITLLFRLFIGGYFSFAAVEKIIDPLVFATSIDNYHLMPSSLVNVFALVIPWLELLCGLMLIVGYKVRTNATLCGAMTLMFTIAVAWAVMQGLKIDCGCFGAKGGEEVSWIKVLQNTGLLAMCVFMVLFPTSVVTVDGWMEQRRA
ncbi:DoxX family membrane protein [soil metagenome]